MLNYYIKKLIYNTPMLIIQEIQCISCIQKQLSREKKKQLLRGQGGVEIKDCLFLFVILFKLFALKNLSKVRQPGGRIERNFLLKQQGRRKYCPKLGMRRELLQVVWPLHRSTAEPQKVHPLQRVSHLEMLCQECWKPPLC